MRSCVGLAALAVLVLVLAGCGDEGRWSRWQAERALWKADLERQRAGRGSAESRTVEAPYLAILARFPAEQWAPHAVTPGIERDVATAVTRAHWRLAQLALDRGDAALAASRAEEMAARWEAVPALAALALDRLAEARIRLGDEAGAQAALERIIVTAPLISDEGFGIMRVVAEAPLALARIARAAGDEPSAQSALLRAEARAVEALPRASGGIAAGLERYRWQVRAARGDRAGALEHGHAIAMESRGDEQLELLLVLAEAALELGLPDSAVSYARESESAPSRLIGGRAMLASARGQLALGRPDSALGVLDRLVDRWYDIGALSPDARYLRAEAMDRLGREETARAERRALLAAHPTHPLAFLALEHIVSHHLDAGQWELARIEGDQALATLARTLETHRDPSVQRDVLRTRTGILERLGRVPEADSSAFEYFGRFPEDSVAQVTLLRGLDRWPSEQADQAALWRARIASRSMSPEVRARARAGTRGVATR